MILVVGGAGYIGSHVVKELIQTEQVIVYDNLSTGHREAVDEHAIFVQGDLMDEERLRIMPIPIQPHGLANCMRAVRSAKW